MAISTHFAVVSLKPHRNNLKEMSELDLVHIKELMQLAYPFQLPSSRDRTRNGAGKR